MARRSEDVLKVDVRKYFAELVGTFLFLTIPYLSVAAIGAATPPTSGLLIVPFSYGFGLLAAIFAFGHISGGHFNPAVTVAMVLDRRTSPVDAGGYIVAQVLGAIAASVLVLVLFDQATVAASVTKPAAGVTEIDALLIEVVLTAGFLVVILAATRHAASLAALAIPLSLVAIHFASASLTGTSVNPARSIGPAVVGGDLTSIWVYLAGPIVGGVLGWAVFKATSPAGE